MKYNSGAILKIIRNRRLASKSGFVSTQSRLIKTDRRIKEVRKGVQKFSNKACDSCDMGHFRKAYPIEAVGEFFPKVSRIDKYGNTIETRVAILDSKAT